MVQAVAERGYPSTTVDQLVSMAGVSKTTFYRHFANKRECYLCTFERIVDRLSGDIAAAFQAAGDLRGSLIAALGVFVTLVVEEPAAASLVVVDSLTLGAAGFDRRERASRRFEQLLEQALAGGAASPTLAAGAVVGGVRGVAYRRLRKGRQAEMPELSEALVDWALTYLRPDGEATAAAVAAAARPAPPPPPPAEALPEWGDPPDSPRSRHALTQRERLVRAAAQLAFEKGYEALSIPAISTTAGVSNQTFYEHFEHKREPLMEAFDALAEEAIATTAAALAGAGDGPEALGVGIRAMLEHIARNEMFARIAFFELPVAGPEALDSGDAVLEAFTAFISPEATPGELGTAVPAPVREAIGSGIWAVLVHECYHGRCAQLAELAPEITRLVVAPLEAAVAA